MSCPCCYPDRLCCCPDLYSAKHAAESGASPFFFHLSHCRAGRPSYGVSGGRHCAQTKPEHHIRSLLRHPAGVKYYIRYLLGSFLRKNPNFALAPYMAHPTGPSHYMMCFVYGGPWRSEKIAAIFAARPNLSRRCTLEQKLFSRARTATAGACQRETAALHSSVGAARRPLLLSRRYTPARKILPPHAPVGALSDRRKGCTPATSAPIYGGPFFG